MIGGDTPRKKLEKHLEKVRERERERQKLALEEVWSSRRLTKSFIIILYYLMEYMFNLSKSLMHSVIFDICTYIVYSNVRTLVYSIFL